MPQSREPLSLAARIYVAAVTVVGVSLAALAARTWLRAPLVPFLSLLALSSAAAAFKIKVPLERGWATMSPSYAVLFASLVMLGPGPTQLMAVVGAWIQSTFHSRTPPPIYRKLFNCGALALSVAVAGVVMGWLGGRPGDRETALLAGPLLGATTAYFLANSLTVATAVALSTSQPVFACWRKDFLWSAPGYYLGGALAAVCVIVIDRGAWWLTLFVAVPVYFVYHTYRMYFRRIQTEQARVQAIADLHSNAVDALASEKERLAVTLSSIGDAVITADLDGRIRLVNNVAEALTGWPREEALGRSLGDVLQLVHRNDGSPHDDPVPRILEHGRIAAADAHLDLVNRDGACTAVHLTGAPISDRDGRHIGVVLVVRDETESMRLERERLRASKLESLGVMAGGIAHDFNNVLTAVVGNLALARNDPGTPEEAAVWLEEAERACLRARALTHQLLTFSKGGDPVKKTMFIGGLLDAAVRFAVRGSSARCIVESPMDLWPVEVDESQFEQVINNIIINAQQAMPRGGVIEVRAANVWASPPGTEPSIEDSPFVRISIRDHGTGIGSEDLPRIFDPYFTTKPTGSGLGLAVAHSVVKSHGGFITVESTVGAGALFNVFLPRAVRLDVPRVASPAITLPHGTGRILVMDDEKMISDVTLAMLRALGYESEAVADGAQALERYRAAQHSARPFDAVIMDLTIPGGMGGVETVMSLRKIDPAARVLVVSGYADSGALADYGQHGFDGLLAKPFSLRDLAIAVRSLLSGETTVH
jgi:PAS domain S-box-containing protein